MERELQDYEMPEERLSLPAPLPPEEETEEDELEKARAEYEAQRLAEEAAERERKKAEAEEKLRKRQEESKIAIEEYNLLLREQDRRKREMEEMKASRPLEYFFRKMEEVAQKPTAFRIAMPAEQVKQALTAAYKAEVMKSGRTVEEIERVQPAVDAVARWLASGNTKFGLMMQGNVGTGKTTLLKAVKTVITILAEQEFTIATARNIAESHRESKQQYKQYCDARLLGIDDLGTEPITVKDYGNDLTPLAELLQERYERRRMTFITTNLSMEKIKESYGVRVADRLAELCNVVRFVSGESYRNTGLTPDPSPEREGRK